MDKKKKILIGVGVAAAAALAFVVIKNKSAIPDLASFNWKSSQDGSTGFVNSSYYPKTSDGKTVSLIENGAPLAYITGTLSNNVINWSTGNSWIKI